ncbi:HAD family hydrolase [Kribbella sp. NPDC003557]|uniref:HAD family hydrolase n=1 Tax=Kribbella sp. NPDC003557 TaxID=3154449 RepID=UPI0033AEB117
MCEGGQVDAARLACFDLDNTLIDRDGAFLAWARWFVGRVGVESDAVEWLVAHDNGGFRGRAELFARFEERFGVAISVEEYDREHPLFTWVEPAVLDGLVRLRAAGWRVAVVTNGTVLQQTAKLQHTGIAQAVDYCCISAAVGVRKPQREIFERAAAGAGATLDGGWMVGDHPAYDIAGGIAAGLRTIRIGHHHAADTPAADHDLDSVVEAFDVILAG